MKLKRTPQKHISQVHISHVIILANLLSDSHIDGKFFHFQIPPQAFLDKWQ